MSTLSTKYEPQSIEDKWYKFWLENDLFTSVPNPQKESYTIVIPPPNVTGVLHMGHMLNNTLQDLLVRRARLQGKNACWVPGTDHASIATEAKVVEKLRNEGIEKSKLTRQQFLEHAWNWKEKHGGIILEQLKKLGASCDWKRTKFTMDDALSEAVIRTFVHFYEKGLIYRGVRMVNWDCVSLTAVSDEEVIDKEVDSKLYYVKYKITGTDEFLCVATTRPETIMADAAICVHPEDERFVHLHHKKVLIPLINKEIPIILDEYVDKDFGTGCLKVTPAHDKNDYEIGLRHKLPVIDILNDNGTLNEHAQILIGVERFEARKRIAKMLDAENALLKVENYKGIMGFSERTNAVIEPKLSLQWFLKMEDIAKPALDYVMTDQVKLIPPKFKNTYKHWMENVRDWCISRQLWWGQQIPAYYLPNGDFVVAENIETALQKAQQIDSSVTENDLKQDPDVLDTWFSSWLWPLSVFDPNVCGTKNHTPNVDFSYYYPTNDLVTAPEILFFWVARMIIAGHEFTGLPPFRNVYLTGIVRDKSGRKMSKQLGNSPDPLDLIAHYGADAVRLGMLLCTSAGNDIMFDEKQIEQGRNFCNKIWNAFRLLQTWTVEKLPQPSASALAITWFEQRLKQTITEVEDHFSKFRINDGVMALYKIFWDDFCAQYLEIIKPAFGQPIDSETYNKTVFFFDVLLRQLHPVMPFISEELWHNLTKREEKESIMVSEFITLSELKENSEILSRFELILSVITYLRNLRQQKGISPKTPLSLQTVYRFSEAECATLQKVANISDFISSTESIQNSTTFVIGTTQFSVPMAQNTDTVAERAKIEAELAHQEKFLQSVQSKLQNEKFVSKAPENVLNTERKKEQDALQRIALLKEQLLS